MKRLAILILLIFGVYFNTLLAQNIYTVAGIGTPGFSGDGGPAVLAELKWPLGMALDAAGNIYISDTYYGLIRKVDANGIITTIGGGGTSSSDGILATSAIIPKPTGIDVDISGNIYFTQIDNNLVRKINTSGIISTVAGVATTSGGFSGDGGPATSAMLDGVSDVAVDVTGNIYIADGGNGRIRMVNTSGIINTIAGSNSGILGDGGLATSAQLIWPLGVAVDNNSNVYITDYYHERVRRVDGAGIITTVAGTGVQGYSGDGGLAINAEIAAPRGIKVDGTGNVYIAEYGYRVRKINNSGIISTVAGKDTSGYSGDGGPAVLAKLSLADVTVDAFGNIFICDTYNNRIRKVCGNLPLTILSSMTVTCASESATLSVNGAGSYTWSTGITNTNIIVAPTVTTTYTVNQSDMVGCSNSGVITQSVNPVPTLTVSATSNTMCAYESVTVTASGADTYTWSTANTNHEIVVSPSVTTTYTVEGSNTYSCSTSSVITIMVDPCVGIKENNINNIKIYPNPTVNTLNISDENNAFENSIIEVTNYLGQTIIKQAYSNTVDVSKLPIGIYTLEINIKGRQSFYSKFIKE
jgi:hypothetical protein